MHERLPACMHAHLPAHARRATTTQRRLPPAALLPQPLGQSPEPRAGREVATPSPLRSRAGRVFGGQPPQQLQPQQQQPQLQRAPPPAAEVHVCGEIVGMAGPGLTVRSCAWRLHHDRDAFRLLRGAEQARGGANTRAYRTTDPPPCEAAAGHTHPCPCMTSPS